MKSLVVILSFLVSFNLYSQDYKKDIRSKAEKEDRHNVYQSDYLSKTDLLKALDFAGIRIFKFPLPVDKEYYFTVILDEYVNGVKSKSQNIYPYFKKNTYSHFGDDSDFVDKSFVDYIDDITFYSKDENDSITICKIETYAFSMGGIKLKKNKEREDQFYNWRHYNKNEPVLDKEIPLLVYASSWYDGKLERFCGTVDLSFDESLTKELLDKSPHYYVISYKVTDKKE